MAPEIIWIPSVIVTFLLAALSTFFWSDRNTTQRKIDKVESDLSKRVTDLERKVDKELECIKNSLADINHKLDFASGIERPAKACRDYLSEAVSELKTDIRETIVTTIRAELYQSQKNKPSGQ